MVNKMWIGTELYNGCFGKIYSKNDVNNILSYADEIGANKIDTAECYNMEAVIGKSLINRKHKFKIATKFGHEFDGSKKTSNFSLNAVKKQLESSLKALNIDHIDLYYFHSGSNIEFDNEDVWKYLIDMKKKGVIGSLGLSLQHNLVMTEDYHQINLAKEYGISVVQTVLNKYSQDSLKYVIPFCNNNNIKVFGRMPLAKGLLTGKYNDSHIFNEDDQRSRSKKLNKEIINSSKSNNYESALSFCTSHVDEVVIGSKNNNQLLQNFQTIN